MTIPAIFNEDHPILQALLGIMVAAKLNEQAITVALDAIAAEHDCVGDGASFPEIAERIGWSNDELLEDLTTRLYETHATPENGCAIRKRGSEH